MQKLFSHERTSCRLGVLQLLSQLLILLLFLLNFLLTVLNTLGLC